MVYVEVNSCEFYIHIMVFMHLYLGVITTTTGGTTSRMAVEDVGGCCARRKSGKLKLCFTKFYPDAWWRYFFYQTNPWSS